MIETELRPGSSIVCRPVGELDWVGAVPLRRVVHDAFAPGLEVVIDLSRVEFIDAAGMSALVGSVRFVRAQGGAARTCNARPQVRRLMELIGVDRLLMPSSVANVAC
ncbi:MAG: STAS domain-containing protein [Acidimicrobiales bacterium]